MSEEPKNIRLNKAAKELNVGIPTLVEYLAKKGHKVDANPNARITPEQYALLETAFQAERQVKENADRIEISTGNSVVIEASQSVVEDESPDYNEEVIIKNFNSTPQSKETPKQEQNDSAEAAEEATPEPEQAETAAPEPEPEPELPKFETKVLRSSVAGLKEGKNAFDAEVRIVDKIDLSAINSRMRPAPVKTKSEKAAEKKKAKEAAAAAKSEKNEKKKKAAEPVEKPVKEEPKPEKVQPVEEPAPEKVEVKVPEKEIEFIETQYQKLEGPKVVSKIDLSQFDKPKPKRDDEKKKKRKRIKKDGVKVDENNPQAAAQADNKDKNAAKGKDKKSEKKKKAAEKKKPEVDDAEIEKQIKETLARLSPMGKSKTSKHNREKRQKVHQQIEEIGRAHV